LDFRRAGLFRQHQQRQRWPVPQEQLLRSRAFVLCPRSDLCGSGCLCSELLCSGCCRSDLLRSGCCAHLLCASSDLLQHGLQQLLQEVALLQAAQAVPAQDQVLQGSQVVLRFDLCSDLRCSCCLCSGLCRSRRLRSDLRCPELCRSGLLPLVEATE
jgi:hypothetical protein